MNATLEHSKNSETNERTHLLSSHPISNSPAVLAHNGDLLPENQSSVPQKNELNALNRIVQDFATYVYINPSFPFQHFLELKKNRSHCRNIIDIAAMDSHNLEPQELNDRIRMYSHKLSQQWGTLQEDSTSAVNGN